MIIYDYYYRKVIAIYLNVRYYYHQIQYYGVIQQATGEDWKDAKLCLSTAMPSVGGTVPGLGTQKLSFKAKTYV